MNNTPTTIEVNNSAMRLRHEAIEAFGDEHFKKSIAFSIEAIRDFLRIEDFGHIKEMAELAGKAADKRDDLLTELDHLNDELDSIKVRIGQIRDGLER